MVGCYLIHLDSPMHHARHYLGWSRDVDRRLAQHGTPSGARMLAVARERGITWRCVRVWRGGFWLEHELKRRHDSPQLCPLCRGDLSPADLEYGPLVSRSLAADDTGGGRYVCGG